MQPSNPKSVLGRDLEVLNQATSLVFKEIEDGPNLKAHLFLPENAATDTPRAAVLFFCGSGWDQGRVTQFAPQALHFAGRGCVSALVEYRLSSTHPGTTPLSAMQDARSAVRWIRHHADQLRVDPQRVVAVGSLAGANIAAAAGMNNGVPDDDTDPPLSARPDAVVLYSPLIEVIRNGYGAAQFADASRMKHACLHDHLESGLPPTFIMHGTRDRLTPFELVEKFVKRSRKLGNVCELESFDGREHSFFNLNVDFDLYQYCVSLIDRFLVDQGILDEPEDDLYDAEEETVRLID